MFLANSRNLVTNLSTDHIIALTFFCFFLLSLIVATILFFIYRQQVKKAYAIDQLIEIIYRHPAYKMLLWFNEVNHQNQNNFEIEFKAASGEYLNLLFNQTSSLIEEFVELTADSSAFSLRIKNRKKTKELKENLGLIKAKLDALSHGINTFFKLEANLRDDAIILHEQINLLEQMYQHNLETHGQNLNLDQDVFQTKLTDLYHQLTTFEMLIKTGGYLNAQTTLKKLSLAINKLSFLVSEYPVVNQYLKFDLESSWNQIINENNFSNNQEIKSRVLVLKENVENLINEANLDLEQLEIRVAKTKIDEVIDLIVKYKKTLAYEEKIKVYLTDHLDEFNDLVQQIELILAEFKSDDKKRGLNSRKSFLGSLNKIEAILAKVDSGTNYLKMKNSLQVQLEVLSENLVVLEQSKPNFAKIEEDYRQYLDLNFEAKHLIRSVELLIKEGEWLPSVQKKRYQQELNLLKEFLVKKEYLSLEEYQQNITNESLRKELNSSLSDLLIKLITLGSEIKYRHQLYRIASAIIPLVDASVEKKEVDEMKTKIVEWYGQKNYQAIVAEFIEKKNLF